VLPAGGNVNASGRHKSLASLTETWAAPGAAPDQTAVLPAINDSRARSVSETIGQKPALPQRNTRAISAFLERAVGRSFS
jgi:hypothetical protein